MHIKVQMLMSAADMPSIVRSRVSPEAEGVHRLIEDRCEGASE